MVQKKWRRKTNVMKKNSNRIHHERHISRWFFLLELFYHTILVAVIVILKSPERVKFEEEITNLDIKFNNCSGLWAPNPMQDSIHSRLPVKSPVLDYIIASINL